MTRELQCCIAGGGPAGMMLGLLLARAGVSVRVLEKHADFLRDFRGDTIHPSTLEVMHELGLLESLLERPHQKAHGIRAHFGELEVEMADFSHLPTRCKFIVFMPQWDFLDHLAQAARRYPNFELSMQTEARDLIEEGGRVVGVRAVSVWRSNDIHAALVVAADGRHSTLRARSGFDVESLGAPMDVLWFRLSRAPGEPAEPMGRFDQGRIFIMLNRGDYWQCGFVIPKGSAEAVRGAGLEAFRAEVASRAPFVAHRVHELEDWEQVRLLTVAVDRLTRWWRPGLLFIGDAAHAMSPIGGVGVNLAIQDAVAAANILAGPLRNGAFMDDALEAVQRRRALPTRLTQGMQLFLQRRVVARAFEQMAHFDPPLPVKLLARFPALRRIPARLIGMGVRPEHVHV